MRLVRRNPAPERHLPARRLARLAGLEEPPDIAALRNCSASACEQAAETKGIHSDVAGDPDILLAPDLEAGNILAKQLTFLANADSAGLVLGARVPIILTSRADSVRSRIASCAVAMLAAHARRKKP